MKKKFRTLYSILTYNVNNNKFKLYKDNKNKAGIYRWTNKIKKKSYIGSSKCINKKIATYLYKTQLIY